FQPLGHLVVASAGATQGGLPLADQLAQLPQFVLQLPLSRPAEPRVPAQMQASKPQWSLAGQIATGVLPKVDSGNGGARTKTKLGGQHDTAVAVKLPGQIAHHGPVAWLVVAIAGRQ